MTRQLASLILCGVSLLGTGCATKSFVEKQVRAAVAKLTQQETATETKLTERIDGQEAKLRETADRVGASRQAVDAASQQLRGLDTRVDQAGVLATDAKTRGDAAHDANARLSQRFAHRNSYRLLETRWLYFEPDRAEIRSQDTTELDDVAKALKADANAVLELQGFADPRGSDRHNSQLARERVEAVTRYLVQRHGIELRQLQAISMGKVTFGAGEKLSTEALAKARRVDMRLLAPWASWEDAVETQMGQAAPAQAATVALSAPRECAQPTPAATAIRPAQPEPTRPIRVARVEPAPARATSRIRSEPDQPAAPKNISPRSGHDGDSHKSGAPSRTLVEFLKSVSPEDLGAK